MRQHLFLLLLCACYAPLQAQTSSIPDTGRIIVLSSRVGPAINQVERQKFGLFESILIHICGSTLEYRNAVVLQLPDSTFRVRFTLARANEPPRDTLVIYSFQVLCRLAERIDHFEEIQAGQYQPGQHPPPMLSTSGEMVAPNAVATPAATARHGELPLASSEGYPYPRYFPAINLGIGLRTYGPDLSGLSQVFGKIPSFGFSPLIAGCIEVGISDALAFQMEGAASVAGEECLQLAVGGFYYIPLLSSEAVQLFVNPSVLLCSVHGTSSDIVVEGGGTGFSGTIGVHLQAGPAVAFAFYGGFCSLPTVATTYSYWKSSSEKVSIPASVKLSSPIFGLRITFSE